MFIVCLGKCLFFARSQRWRVEGEHAEGQLPVLPAAEAVPGQEDAQHREDSLLSQQQQQRKVRKRKVFYQDRWWWYNPRKKNVCEEWLIKITSENKPQNFYKWHLLRILNHEPGKRSLWIKKRHLKDFANYDICPTSANLNLLNFQPFIGFCHLMLHWKIRWRLEFSIHIYKNWWII